jgi:hypothetical protein
MKKEYNEPQMEVIEVELQSMICESLEADPTQNSPTMDSLDDIEFEDC